MALNGILEKDGIQFLGSALSYIMNMDKVEHVNVSILMPLCRSVLFDISGLVPLSQLKALKLVPEKRPKSSSIFNDDQKAAVANLFKSYYDSLISHLKQTCLEMNRLQKLIKKQERTRGKKLSKNFIFLNIILGDASADDRQKYEQIKGLYDRLLQNTNDLGDCLGEEIPEMVEEPSDDEPEESIAKRLALNEGKVNIWQDLDSQVSI